MHNRIHQIRICFKNKFILIHSHVTYAQNVVRMDAIWQKLVLIPHFEVKNAQLDTPDQILFQK